MCSQSINISSSNNYSILNFHNQSYIQVQPNDMVFTLNTAGNFVWYRNNGRPLQMILHSGGLNVANSITATTFNATSDYRIKTNITQLIENIDDLKPKKYYNKQSKKNEFGLIAHEVQEIFPDMVNGIKDEINDKREPVYQSINYTGIIPILIKEIQDLKKQYKKQQEQINKLLQYIEINNAL